MYRKNDQHQQQSLFSSINDLPPKKRERLQASWAATFYADFFSRIDEDHYAVLYSDEPSRPNAPVNVLVGLEVLKAGFGWSDEQLDDQFSYNLQVRYALGYRDVADGHLDLRTVYNFRHRLTNHMQQTGENLLEQTFEQVSDEQIASLKLKTDKLRMDSTLVSSNIRQMSRLQLLVEVLQRVWRLLNETEKEQYKADFEAFTRGTSGQYTYHVTPDEVPSRLETIGQLMRRLVDDLAENYSEQMGYKVLARVYAEHFVEEEAQIRLKTGSELSANSLQSPDDWEATYRKKRGEGHQGYVTNVTETCHPDNDVQLIVKVQTEANTTDDAAMLDEAVPGLVERTDVNEMQTDGGYNSADVDKSFNEHGIKQVQTAIRGSKSTDDRLSVSDFVFIRDDNGIPQTVRCPQGQEVEVMSGRADGRFTARFDANICVGCPLLEKCPTRPLKRKPQHRILRFDQQQVNVAHRHENQRQAKASGHNLRSAVEATVRSVKHPFGNGKLPVRGRPRMSMMMVASAAMTNVRRIWRGQQDKNGQPQAENGLCGRLLRLLRFVRTHFWHQAPAFDPACA
jgi:hypothetical protein